VVDRATLAVQDVVGDPPNNDVLSLLRRARAVMVCPQLFKAGFFLGGEGGNCVLLARDGAGSWSAPAFYSMGSASFGLQIGVQDAELVLAVLTEHGLSAMLDSQFKLGGDASLAIASFGAGLQGATSAALGADIVAFERTRGLFAGISLQGSVLSAQTGWNNAYYGQPLASRQIVIQMQANNPGADPLRAVLTRFGGQPVAAAPAEIAAPPPRGAPVSMPPRQAPAPSYAAPGYPTPPPYSPPPRGAPAALAPGAIQSQSLPPPR